MARQKQVLAQPTWEEVAALAKSAGWTQYEVAKICETNTQEVWYWSKGKRKIPPHHWRRLRLRAGMQRLTVDRKTAWIRQHRQSRVIMYAIKRKWKLECGENMK